MTEQNQESTSEPTKDQLSVDDAFEGKDNKGAGKEGGEGAENGDAPEKTPSTDDKGDKEPRTFSQEEWDKRQSALDAGANKLKETHAKELEDLGKRFKELEDTVTKKARADVLKKAEEAGEDVDLAGTLFDKEQDLKKREIAVNAKEEKMVKVARHQKADSLIEEHKLDKDVKEKLLEADSPEAMENIALRLALGDKKAGATPATKTDSGDEAGKGDDMSKITDPEAGLRVVFKRLEGKNK